MKKMEHKTYLSGAVVVDKTHSRIELRGRLDSLIASLLELQHLALLKNSLELIDELEEVREKLNELLLSEVTGGTCSELRLWGYDSDEIRERSYNPLKYYGLGHIRPHYTMGDIAVALNTFRTKVRETELCACRAFSGADGGEPEREDIVRVLNRLSSAFYILMYKYLPKGYDKTITF